MLDVVVPVKDRDLPRIERCINSVINNSPKEYISSVTIVDYGSKKSVVFKGANVIRVDNLEFNKAHALNLGIKEGKADYIMTLDCDMMLSKKHMDFIFENLKDENFIVATNVRRITEENIKPDYDEMIVLSSAWGNQDKTQFFNLANGGFQVYSRKFYEKIGGIMESMGKYLGGIDNYTYFLAKSNNLNIVDLSYPLLHQEHDKKKEQNYDLKGDDLEKAKAYRALKSGYLDKIAKLNIKKNIEPIAGEKPAETMFTKFDYEWTNKDRLFREALDNGKDHIELLGQTYKIEKAPPKILIAIINNYDTLPTYFAWDLLNLYHRTRSFFPEVDLQQVNACDVNSMRNLAAKFSLGGNPDKVRYDYLVMLDDDHHYPQDFLIRFIQLAEKNKYDVITGLTSGKKPPYRHTQYHKFISPIETEGNNVVSDVEEDKIIQIEASGPVGMLINTRVFEKIKFPWYHIQYGKNDKGQDTMLGGDLYFCKQLKEAGIPIHLDLKTSFPHGLTMFLERGKVTSGGMRVK